MDNQNALMEIQQKYKDCNLLLPVSSEVQLNPFYKYTVMEVKADVSDNSGDIFKVGSIKTGEANGKAQYVAVYSPAKPLLMKLAAAAGIQFDPNNTYGTYNMTLLRKTFAEKAMTGAILRVIRALIGLKGTYTVP